ncbi:subtype B tannase [Telmatobacter bradus]|uniref:subtype B tannase n=1 Tax=Telmatobacter bradus TaxID=474953 RepID=UPI003B436D19
MSTENDAVQAPQRLRRLVLYAALGAGALSCAHAQSTVPASNPLLFPKDQFKLETKTIKTAAGEKKVVYRLYQHIPYVAKPVDKEYESLDVKVPVSVDGVEVHSQNAPILFVVGVGGYMSASNYKQHGPDGPGAPGAPGGKMEMGAPGGPGGPGGPPPGAFQGANGTAGGPEATQNMALAEGYVVVAPGARGRDNKAADGSFYGKAPAAIVDLKAAVRYIRHNKGILPGNMDWIVSSGCSAGGGLSALLGASGNSPLYEPYLQEIGAAEEKDNVFASGCGSPVTDLEHADMPYEWAFGASKLRSGAVDAKVSAALKERFPAYEASLHLQGKEGFGQITVDNLDLYLVKEYFAPAATQYLLKLTEDKRKEYLAKNPWLKWDGKTAQFSYLDYAAQHITRMKSAPAFDGLTLRSPESNEFGNKTTDSRHYTDFSLQQTTGNPNAHVDPVLQQIVNLMNPMYFTGAKNPGAAEHWWIRHGGIETDSAPTNTVNLALSLENMGRDVNAAIFWEAGHCQDLDPQGFITWISTITGYKQ